MPAWYDKVTSADRRLKKRLADVKHPSLNEAHLVEIVCLGLGIVFLGYPLGIAMFNPRAAPWSLAFGGLLQLALSALLASSRAPPKRRMEGRPSERRQPNVSASPPKSNNVTREPELSAISK